jgi:eukaryotic-like serine/threonine-protein kinase
MAKDFTFGASPEHLKRLLFAGLDEVESDKDVGSPASPADLAEGPGAKIGCYKLVRVLGEGGMGIVYLAEQEHPIKRQVALKIIKPGMDSKQVIARIESERQALALLDHPNIAHIYDAGTTAGRPYFAMEYIQGVPIVEHCDQQKLTIEQRLQLFLGVCEAIQHAHQKGIIHRDIKPSNLLIHMEGEKTVPKVIDFGIAKAMSQALTERTLVTEQGHFVGTPEYMSPEQAQASGQDTDTRSDIYSLGVVLYELLAGVLPFDPKALREGGPDHARKVIREEEPKTPSRQLTVLGKTAEAIAANRQTEVHALTRRLHRELEWIPLKAMRKDPARRYRSASELADDIRNYLDGHPLIAGPETVAYRVRKFVRRNRVLVGAGATVVAVLVLGIVGSTWQAVRATRAEREQSRERQRAEQSEQKETEARKLAQAQAYASDMKLAQQAISEGNIGGALELLNRHRPRAGQTDLRGWEWRYLWERCRGDALFTLCQQSNSVFSLAASADGKWLAVGELDSGVLSIWDLQTRQKVAALVTYDAFVRAAFSPTAPLLAFSGTTKVSLTNQQHVVRLWDGATRTVVAEFPLEGPCAGLVFSGDGRTLVTCTRSAEPGGRGQITLWQVSEKERRASHPMRPEAVTESTSPTFAAAPDMSVAAYGVASRGRANDTVCVMDLATGKELWIRESTDLLFSTFAFSPDGKILATGSANVESRIRLLEVSSGRDLGALEGHRGSVRDIVFWPDGKTLVSASNDKTIRLWNMGTRQPLGVLCGHGDEVWRLALLPDKTTLASSSMDGSVCVWDTARMRIERTACQKLTDLSLQWSFASDSQALIALDNNGRVARWQGPYFQDREPLMDFGTNPVGLRLSRDGRLMAKGSSNGAIEVWDLQERRSQLQLPVATASVTVLGFLAKGRGLVTLHPDDRLVPVPEAAQFSAWSKLSIRHPETVSVHESDLSSGRETRVWPGRWPAETFSVAQSSDDRWLLAMSLNGAGWLGDRATGRETVVQLDTRGACDLAFSWDGKYFGASSWGGSWSSCTRIWDTVSLREVAQLPGIGLSVAFAPDGKRLAVGGLGGETAITLWDLETQQKLITLGGEGSNFWRSEFSPDGSVLASSNMKGVLHLWRAPSWTEIESAERQQTGDEQP